MASGHNLFVSRQLSKGDLVEVNLGIFSHWGVCVGGQNIIHLVGLSNGPFALTSQDELFSISGKAFSRAEVRLDDFWTFIGSPYNKAEIKNNLDSCKVPLPASDIVKNAQSSIGEIACSHRTKNCENFAKWCRYGDYNSTQAQQGVVSRYVPTRGRNSPEIFGSRKENKDLDDTLAGVAGAVVGIAGLALGAYGIYKLFSGDGKEEKEQKQRPKNYGDNSSSSGEDFASGNMSDYFTALSGSARSQRSWKQKEDQYYGRFRCNTCGLTWDSSKVYTLPGTKKVKYGQKCRYCQEDFIKPYELQLILCSVCNSRPCICRCDDCGKLKHRPNEESYGYSDHQYCSCEKRRNKDVGFHINPRKPHLSEYCEKCLSGRPCTLHD